MEVRVFYAKEKLEATVNYIATHHPFFKGAHDKVRENVLDSIQDLVDQYPRITYVSRDGFYVWMADLESEGIDHDENTINIEFMVDPYLHEYIAPPYTSVVLRKRHEPR